MAWSSTSFRGQNWRACKDGKLRSTRTISRHTSPNNKKVWIWAKLSRRYAKISRPKRLLKRRKTGASRTEAPASRSGTLWSRWSKPAQATTRSIERLSIAKPMPNLLKSNQNTSRTPLAPPNHTTRAPGHHEVGQMAGTPTSTAIRRTLSIT